MENTIRTLRLIISASLIAASSYSITISEQVKIKLFANSVNGWGWRYWSGSVLKWVAITDPLQRLADGACGTASGVFMNAVPTTNLCATGAASMVTGANPWNWSCAGRGGGSTASCSTSGPVGIPGNWALVFNDEFNGTALDTTSWNPTLWSPSYLLAYPQIGTANNFYETAAYDPAQVMVSGGYLHLSLINSPVTLYGKYYPNRTGIIESYGKREFTYGVFESRIYFPAASPGVVANWPSFWIVGAPPWPANGELDVVEGINGEAHCAFHSPDVGYGSAANRNDGTTDYNDSAKGQFISGDYTGWHTFGANWQPGVVNYYYDGVNVCTIKKGITSSPMWLVLLNAQAGWDNLVPAEMFVDYVRVWQTQ